MGSSQFELTSQPRTSTHAPPRFLGLLGIIPTRNFAKRIIQKQSASRMIPLLSTQLLGTYSGTFDTPFFEQHPIAWNSKKERFTISHATSCKLYWFNIIIMLFLVNGGFTIVILSKAAVSGPNSAWIRIFFPLLTWVMGALFMFVLNTAQYAQDVTNLIENLVTLERRVLHGQIFRNFAIKACPGLSWKRLL